MFKKTITYTDFNDEEQTQDFYFHFSKADLLALASDGTTMMDRIQRIMKANDGRAILNEFRAIVWQACGIRSEDGARFIKSEEAKSSLMDSPAFDELLMELATNAEASADFVRQLIPEKLQNEVFEQLKNTKGGTVEVPAPFKEAEDNRPLWMKEHRNPTDDELMAMSKEEMRIAFQLRK
jgi:hypothetical protein